MDFKSLFLIVLLILLNVYSCFGTESEDASTSSTSNIRASCLALLLRHPMMKGSDLAAWGRQLMEAKEYHKALKCFDKAIDRNSLRGSYYGLRGICLFEMGKVSAAVTAMEYAVTMEMHPERNINKPIFLNETELATMGRVLCDVQKFTPSLWCFAEAMKMGPNNASHFRQRGECYMKMGNNYFALAIDDFRKVVRVGRGPHVKDDIERLSRALIDHEKYDDAIKEISLIDNTGAELIRLGDELRFNRKKLNEAWTCYNAAIDKNPENANYFQKRGSCYMSMGMYSRAVSDFRSAIFFNPEIDNGAFHLTEALFYSDNRTEALEVSTALDDIHLEILGRKFLANGKFQESLDCYNEALRKNSENAFAYAQRGICNRELGNLEAALSDFENSLRRQSDNKSVQLDKCEVLLKTGSYGEAAEVLRELEENTSKYMLTPSDFNRIDIAHQIIIEEAIKRSQLESTANDDHAPIGSESSPTISSPR